MGKTVFLDTNILIYAFAENDERLDVAERLVNEGAVVSIQILNEVMNTLLRKFGFGWRRIDGTIESILITCPDPLPLTLDTHRSAMRLCERYGFSVYDAMIVASALEAGCTKLYTEDLHHGQVVEGLRIENPFRGLATP